VYGNSDTVCGNVCTGDFNGEWVGEFNVLGVIGIKDFGLIVLI
jgi:hypothetical protein